MRLFVGLMVPKEISTHIRACWSEIDPKPTGYQAIDPLQWHVTFVFLGEVPDARHDAIANVIQDWASRAEPMSFKAVGFVTFPPTDHRYLAAHLDSYGLEKIAASIEQLRMKLVEVVPTLDNKPWLPHISIQKSFRDAQLFSWKQSMPSIDWNPAEVVLAKSSPGRVGSVYTTLKSFKLPQET